MAGQAKVVLGEARHSLAGIGGAVHGQDRRGVAWRDMGSNRIGHHWQAERFEPARCLVSWRG